MSNDSIEAIGSVDKKKGVDKGGEAGASSHAHGAHQTQQTQQPAGGNQAQESKGVEGINTQDSVHLSQEAKEEN